MPTLGLSTAVVDPGALRSTIRRLRELGVRLPTFAQLADPSRIPEPTTSALASVDPDAADPMNLFRVHWYNAADRRGRAEAPEHLVLPEALTGVAAPILVALGDRFPMIAAHKVLAAYGCLAPRLVTGQFDPARHRAIWPSTGNYCRGGVAISRIMGCRGVAVLPEGMSAERFDWLDRWAADPADIIRTLGSESNVKEIYDTCAELDRDPRNVIFNQFCEFGNHLVHWKCTGAALRRVFEEVALRRPGLAPFAFVSASGSAGTLGAGDRLRDDLGTRTVAVEALECPTLLYNGFGAHNIQGIGDKHVPYIHNVMGTDMVAAVSDRATDDLFVLFNTEAGRRYLVDRRGVDSGLVAALSGLGLSSIGNMLAAIKVARRFGLGPDQALLTVATDGAAMYGSERERLLARDWPRGFDAIHAAEVYGARVLGANADHLRELDHLERSRIFNLGYFTWVEQQGVALEDFELRRHQSFWRELRALVPAWDALIEETNARVAEG